MMSRMFIFLLVTANVPLFLHARRPKLRVMHGVTDTKGKYPYVVALLVNNRIRVGSGTLISSEWILTAAHCFDSSASHIQYGNMTIMPNMSSTVSLIVAKMQHPAYRPNTMSNDVALGRVSPAQMQTFAQISAVDYTSLVGKAVEYAAYGYTHLPNKLTDRLTRPLQIGEGVVIPCKGYTLFWPAICVAPKCSNKKADVSIGDSGGPLFYDGKIIGVVSWGDGVTPIGRYAAVSPFLTWIQEVMSS